MLISTDNQSTTTFSYKGFKFIKVINLKSTYIQFQIKYLHDGTNVINTSFSDVDDFECQREIIQNAIDAFIECNTSELERLYAYLDSGYFTKELKQF